MKHSKSRSLEKTIIKPPAPTGENILHFEGNSFNFPEGCGQCLPPNVPAAANQSVAAPKSRPRQKSRTKPLQLKTNDNVRLNIISLDFGVELVGQNDGIALFAAERENHFHFVVYENAEHRICQSHIPHYAMAVALNTKAQFPRTCTDLLFFGLDSTPVHLATRDDEKLLGFSYSDRFIYPKGPAGKKLRMAMDKAASLLEAAKKQVQERNGIASLPNATTVDGLSVESHSTQLIEAIAFEKERYGELNAKRFGVFSAFCTHREFSTVTKSHQLKALRYLVNFHLENPPETLPDNELHREFIQIAIQVQDRLLPRRIWGPGVNVSIADAVTAAKAGLGKLSEGQRTQYALLNGMHQSGLFYSLAVITKCISFNKYMEMLAAAYQPDSQSEQYIRATSAYIELFGKVCSGEHFTGIRV